MKTSVLMGQHPGTSLLLAAALLAGGGVLVAGAGGRDAGTPAAGPVPAVARPDAGKAVPPGHSELAESAFKKLDADGKGFITLDDVKSLPGFELIFEACDGNHDGKLSPVEFKKAWAAYTAGENGNRG